MPKKDIRLYNAFFPIYALLLLFPSAWLLVLPVNFLIDSAVVLLTLNALKLPKKALYKKTILKVWGFGFLADCIGAALLLALAVLAGNLESLESTGFWADFSRAVAFNPFRHPIALLLTLACLALSGVCIYFFNLKISFRYLDIQPSHAKRLALMLAVFTAPYLFLFPSEVLMPYA